MFVFFFIFITVLKEKLLKQNGNTFPFDATAAPGYVWHCHILNHEDNDMMRPIKIIS